jgi:D-aminopeptidase
MASVSRSNRQLTEAAEQSVRRSPSARLTEDEAAEFLGVEASTLSVWRCTKRYPLPYIKVGRLVRYDLEDLVKFCESRRVMPIAANGGR